MNETLIQINSDVDNKTIGYGVHELVGFPVSGDSLLSFRYGLYDAASDYRVHDGLYTTGIYIENPGATLYDNSFTIRGVILPQTAVKRIGVSIVLYIMEISFRLLKKLCI